MKWIVFYAILCFFTNNVLAQFSLTGVPNNLVKYELDSAKINTININCNYVGDGTTQTMIGVTMNKGIVTSPNLTFATYSFNITNNSPLSIQIIIAPNFSYKDFEGRSIFLELKMSNIILGASPTTTLIQVNFSKKMPKDDQLDNDFFRLNVGANFDFIQTNPVRLLYLDGNLMSQKAFKLKILDEDRDFGIYGRIFQFQGLTQIDNVRPINFRDTLGINGQPTIIKKISEDKYKIAQPIMSRSFGDVIKQTNYGLAFGISKTVIDDDENKFNLSLGLHFEGLLTVLESEIKYDKIISDTIEVSKTQYIKEFSNELPIIKRGTSFQNTIGFSIPISWRFSAFELRVLPAFSLFNSRANTSFGNLPEGARGYSLYANLSEIKETGLNIGCEVRGYSKMRPSTFSIFVAKVFNLDKLGNFFKLN